jgi:UDP-N-acetyl-D-glucosamine dehydrogenase
MTERRTVGVVGLGYVGLPLAVEFALAGDEVIGVDINATRVAALRAGESYIEDVPDGAVREAGERLQVTGRMSSLALADAIIVCVPTPLTANREPDLGPLMDAARALGGLIQPGQLIVLESTTYPGTTRDRLLPALEESGLKAGTDFHLAFSPERVDPGRTDYTLRTTPKIIGGHTEACGDAAESLYARVCDSVVRVSSPDVAEMAKLLENVFRSVNIALVNELAMLAERMGIDIHEVVDAAATKPFGFMRFDPGPGMGGHCLPVDPFYLSWRAREFDLTTEFIELAGKVNQQMPYYCAGRVEEALNELGLPVKGTRIAILGVSYKPGVGDVRESPAVKIIGRLRDLGAEIAYHDEYVEELRAFDLKSSALDEALDGASIAVIVTAHPGIDFAAVAERVPVVDLRGVLRERRAEAAPPVDRGLRRAGAAHEAPLRGD